MIDFHCHLLPGLDDGSATIDEAIEMAVALQKAGFITVYCTPHFIKSVYEANNEEIRESLNALQTRLKNENINLQLLAGREYYLDEFLLDYLKNPLPLGDTNMIMLEIPRYIPPELVKETCYRIKCSGFIPMIAHPERCDLFSMLPKKENSGFRFLKTEIKNESSNLLPYLVDLGCAFQGNLGSFNGYYGPHVQKTANSLKKMAVYTHFGTDLHSSNGIKYLRGA